MLQPPSLEPYASVSFQHKQPTSPYPGDKETSGHRDAFLDALLQRSGALGRQRRWRRYRGRILAAAFILALFLIYFSNTLLIYAAFLRIKLDNALFDSRWLPCGVLRKEPILYIQDTEHVQVVWEMNCIPRGSEPTMQISWQHKAQDEKQQKKSVDAVVLDDRHTLFKATIGPLDKSGQYEYQITHQRRPVARHQFRWHAKETTQPIRIAAMADNQFGLLTFVSLLRQVNKNVDYLLHAGDAVQNYPSLRQWQTDFAGPLTYFGLGQRMPMIYAHGNHDHDPLYEYHYTRVGPSNDPWFAFSLANGAIRFVVLDSNLDWRQQDTWLQSELASAAFQEAQFRVIVVHVPPFLEYWDPEAWFEKHQSEWGAFVKNRFVPLFEKYGVDLVISGHQHNYERGSRNGIHYTIIGGAGGDIDTERVEDYDMYESTLTDFHHVLLEFLPPVEQGGNWRLVWEMYDLRGNNMDSMQITAKSRSPMEQIIVDDDEQQQQGAVAKDAIEELTFRELVEDDPPETN